MDIYDFHEDYSPSSWKMHIENFISLMEKDYQVISSPPILPSKKDRKNGLIQFTHANYVNRDLPFGGTLEMYYSSDGYFHYVRVEDMTKVYLNSEIELELIEEGVRWMANCMYDKESMDFHPSAVYHKVVTSIAQMIDDHMDDVIKLLNQSRDNRGIEQHMVLIKKKKHRKSPCLDVTLHCKYPGYSNEADIFFNALVGGISFGGRCGYWIPSIPYDITKRTIRNLPWMIAENAWQLYQDTVQEELDKLLEDYLAKLEAQKKEEEDPDEVPTPDCEDPDKEDLIRLREEEMHADIQSVDTDESIDNDKPVEDAVEDKDDDWVE